MNYQIPKEVKVDLAQQENSMEKIYFDGCSYTWGQSLELYCNNLDKFAIDRLSKYVFTKEDIEFINKNRYSFIVSNYTKCEEKNNSVSGKSNGKILKDIESININEYKYVVIQLTHFDRFFTNGREWKADPVCYKPMINCGEITNEIVEYSILNSEKIQYDYFLQLEKIFVDCSEKLKIIFHSDEWEDILSYDEIQRYGISIDGEYMIKRWAEQNKMFINQQPEFKGDKNLTHDTHLCIEGHKILAESIIKQL
jgi:hypothetical protein